MEGGIDTVQDGGKGKWVAPSIDKGGADGEEWWGTMDRVPRIEG